jgi:CDP-diacylglycerol--serine O-phosphatidyltransferase
MKIPSTRVVVPNLFTLAATFCGISVLWLSMGAESPADFYLACTLIPLACILDGFDGRVARMLHGETKFGMELDSLSDAITFGVAPAFVLYAWALKPYGFAGLCVTFVFAAAAMLRLARFNVQSEKPNKGNRYFTGLPAPMGGMGIASIIALQVAVLDRDIATDAERPYLAIYALLLAVLMVSEVPFRTFKDFRLTRANRLLLAAVLASVVIVGLYHGFMVALAIAHMVYLSTGLAGTAVREGRRLLVAGGVGNRNQSVVLDDEDDD